MNPLLTVSDVSVSYRTGGAVALRRTTVHAVERVSFDVGAGETLGIVGESGSGKTTIGRAVLRLAEISAGRVLFDGVDIARFGRSTPLSYRRDVQAVFQDPGSSMNPRKRVAQIIGAPLRRHGLATSRAELNRRLTELLDRVGLPERHLDRYPGELSGGQQQRVAIARALAVGPRLLVCDEVVSALDVSTQGQIVNLLQDLQERLGLAYLFIGHDLAVVRHVSHRIGVLRHGELVELGAADAVCSAPAHPYTRALLQAAPTTDPDLQREKRRARRMSTQGGFR